MPSNDAQYDGDAEDLQETAEAAAAAPPMAKDLAAQQALPSLAYYDLMLVFKD
jgi:hypothetical protein